MNIEDQTISYKYAKKLKELGIKCPSLFCFTTELDLEFLPSDIRNEKVCIAAFTVAELLDLLPRGLITKLDEPFNSFRLKLQKSYYVEQCEETKSIKHAEHVYIVNYYCDSTECTGEDAWLERTLTKNICDRNSANCLAKMLIYLFENGFNVYELIIGNKNE